MASACQHVELIKVFQQLAGSALLIGELFTVGALNFPANGIFVQAVKNFRLITAKVDHVEGKSFGFSGCVRVHGRDRAHFNVAQPLAIYFGLYECEDLFQFACVNQRLAVIGER